MTIGILAAGDEIIQGDTLNTNGHAIAHALYSEGLPVGFHLSCSDKEEEIVSCLDFLSQHHDIIILLGGLGPTSDDRTRFALARFLNMKLIEFSEALDHIKTRLSHGNLALNPGNRQQALFPSCAVLLPNPNGTAMGCYFHGQDKLFILLPGPPRECLPMFNQHALPVLQKTQHSDQERLKWRLFGVSEGAIAEKLDLALSGVDCEIGYRLETPYLEFKVRCHEADVEKVRLCIEPIIAPHIIAPPELKASARLRQQIEELKLPVVIVDDITGGLLQRLIQRPSNYQYLTFHEGETDRVAIRFQIGGLDEYWSGKEGPAVTNITINYQYEEQRGSETHQVPYRSPLVIDYAAEWLSFRLFHLINQLHQ